MRAPTLREVYELEGVVSGFEERLTELPETTQRDAAILAAANLLRALDNLEGVLE